MFRKKINEKNTKRDREFNFHFLNKISIIGSSESARNFMGIFLSKLISKQNYYIHTKASENVYEVSYSEHEIYSLKSKNDITLLLDRESLSKALNDCNHEGVIIFDKNQLTIKDFNFQETELIPVEIELKPFISEESMNLSIHFLYSLVWLVGIRLKNLDTILFDFFDSREIQHRIEEINNYISISQKEYLGIKKLNTISKDEELQVLQQQNDDNKHRVFISGIELFTFLISRTQFNKIFYTKDVSNVFLNQYFNEISNSEYSDIQVDRISSCDKNIHKNLVSTFLGDKRLSIIPSSKINGDTIQILNFSARAFLPTFTIIFLQYADWFNIEVLLKKYEGIVIFLNEIEEITSSLIETISLLNNENISFIILVNVDTLVSSKLIKVDFTDLINKIKLSNESENMISLEKFKRIDNFNYYTLATQGGNNRPIPANKVGQTTFFDTTSNEDTSNKIKKYRRRLRKKIETYEIFGNLKSRINFVTYGKNKNMCLESMRYLQTIGFKTSLIYYKTNLVNKNPLQISLNTEKIIFIGDFGLILDDIYSYLLYKDIESISRFSVIKPLDLDTTLKNILKIIET